MTIRQEVEKAHFSLKKTPWLCDLGFILAIFAALFLFFPDMFFLKQGFLSGDHRVQHYPWASFYADCLREWRLPWWTSLFHCGFPLLAEGQVGAFYPLNLIFYFFLPTFMAYNYEILAHYFLGGIFFFLYMRSLKLSGSASFLGALVFLFGTCQGGLNYNVISQKVLVWFPLTLYLSDRIIEQKKKATVFLLALIYAFQFFAGYLQYAVYSVGFSLFYFLWFSVAEGIKERKISAIIPKVCLLGFAFLLSLALSSPQLLATWELASFSNRLSVSEAFAYLGSVNPLSLATLFFPRWDGFLKAELYVGWMGLFFVFVSLMTKKSRKEVFFIILAVLSFALALGKFNPLYVAFIKLTHFYGFRTPVKFLFFTAFALAVLAAFGFEKWIRRKEEDQKSKDLFPVFLTFTGIGLGLYLAANIVFRTFAVPVKEWLRGYVEKAFTDGVVHTLPLEDYLTRLNIYYDMALEMISPFEKWNVVFLGFILISMLGLWLSGRLFQKRIGWLVKTGFFLLLFLNLYAYSFTSVKGNYETYAFIDPPSKILDFVKRDQSLFRVHRAATTIEASEAMPLLPQVNMLHNIPVTGGYSPLVMKDYFNLMEGLGDLNDSQRVLLASKESVENHETLLKFLNVKYLITDFNVKKSWVRELLQEGPNYLYEIRYPLPRVIFKPDGSDPKIVRYEDESVTVELSAESPGELLLGDVYYPGWKVYVNGEEAPLSKSNVVFRAIRIREAGEYLIEFKYLPIWKHLAWMPLFGGVMCLVLAWRFWNR